MIAYSIAGALNTKLFTRVIVSTDDPLIGQIAEWYGAEYLPRPVTLATDEAGSAEVGLHVLETVMAQGTPVDCLCQMMPNCPLRRSEDICGHYRLFIKEQRAFQISVVPYRGVYPHWALTLDEAHRGHWLFGVEDLRPSQELGTSYCPTGAIWWARASDFIAERTFYGNPFFLAPMDANRGMDIDRLEELELSELLVQGLRARDGVTPLETVSCEPYPWQSANA